MEVTFTKIAGRRYLVTISRERGPELATRQGPGYHEYLPHDAVHFIVESEAALSDGVFGQIAAGRSNIFTTADPALRRRQARREARKRTTTAEIADMSRSESLASLCSVLWEIRAGRRRQLPAWLAETDPALVNSLLVERILGRLDEFANRWHALPDAGSITLVWDPERHAERPRSATGRRARQCPASGHRKPLSQVIGNRCVETSETPDAADRRACPKPVS